MKFTHMLADRAPTDCQFCEVPFPPELADHPEPICEGLLRYREQLNEEPWR